MQKRHEKSLTKKSIVLITNQLTLLLIKKKYNYGTDQKHYSAKI